jgi:ectoine hydroxylase-related dioxygenase (phytanoyl-CoA dioxygenase family)
MDHFHLFCWDKGQYILFWIKKYPDPNVVQQKMQEQFNGTPVPGKKGDIILWLQTLPHAASAIHSDLAQVCSIHQFFKAIGRLKVATNEELPR